MSPRGLAKGRERSAEQTARSAAVSFAATIGFALASVAWLSLVPLSRAVSSALAWGLVLALSGAALWAAVTGRCIACWWFEVLVERRAGEGVEA